MKKWLAMLLAMMMAFALAACGNADNIGNDAKEFARGSWAENVYTNDSLGLPVTVPENWEIADDEELAELMEQAGGLLPADAPRQRDAPEQSGMTMK